MILRKSVRVYLALGSTDLRKAVNGLSVLVEQAMGLDPFCGDLFVFCNRRQNIKYCTGTITGSPCGTSGWKSTASSGLSGPSRC